MLGLCKHVSLSINWILGMLCACCLLHWQGLHEAVSICKSPQVGVTQSRLQQFYVMYASVRAGCASGGAQSAGYTL